MNASGIFKDSILQNSGSAFATLTFGVIIGIIILLIVIGYLMYKKVAE